MKFKAYPLICRAVEEGVGFGLNRAFKHTYDPTREALAEAIEREVTSALCEILDFEDAVE